MLVCIKTIHLLVFDSSFLKFPFIFEPYSCKDPRTYDCQYDGLIRMGPCFFDAPLFFAMGNFKGMDRRIRSTIGQDESEISLPDRQSFYLDPVSNQ